MQNNQKIIVLIIIVLLLVLGGLFLVKNKKDGSKSGDMRSPSAVVDKVNVDFKENPEKFPTEIPIESGAKITQNYNATTPTGQFQATKVFVTQLSLSDNLKLYTDYFSKNGWATSGIVDQPTYKSVTGTKDGNSVVVSIDENKTGSKIKTVSITYIEKLGSATK